MAKIFSESVQDRAGNDAMKVRIVGVDGDEMIKTISLADYFDLFNQSLEREASYVNINPLHMPNGYIKGLFADENTYKLLWKVKGKNRQLIHTSGHYRVPFPDLVFLLCVKNNVITKKRVWAVDNEGQMYQYPFGNVDTSGNICMGNISTRIENGASSFEEDFFLGITNNDYFSEEGSHIVPMWSQEKLLRELSKEKVFPQRWLKKVNWTLPELEEKLNIQ